MQRLIWVLLLVLLAGCANDYKQFYQPNPAVDMVLLEKRRANAPSDNPKVGYVHPSKLQETMDMAARKGFVIVGGSAFSSGTPPTEQDAIQQARDLKADVVIILSPTHAETINSVMPITTPSTSTTYSTGSATAYGPNGPVTAYGSGTSTTYGTQTTYVPIQIDRSNYGAYYLVKIKLVFGAQFRELTDNEKRLIQSNKGVGIESVADGTPAYDSDILPGDIIQYVNGERVSDFQHMKKIIDANIGKQLNLDIYRSGAKISKIVTLANE